MIKFNIYYVYFFILVLIKALYQYVLNVDNRIEYYYYNNEHYIKYKILTSIILVINIVIIMYMKYILKELLYKYIN